MKIKKTMCVAAAAALTLTIAACGGSSEESAGGGDQQGEPQVIKFAFAPEAVWDMMKDTGTLAKWEQENNVHIETSTTWDEFTFFAGGHGDIVSMSAQETPVLEAETGIKTVTLRQVQLSARPILQAGR